MCIAKGSSTSKIVLATFTDGAKNMVVNIKIGPLCRQIHCSYVHVVVRTCSYRIKQNGYWAPIGIANSTFYLAIGNFGE